MIQKNSYNTNYIQIYDNVIPAEVCDDIVYLFEQRQEQQECILLEGHRSFTQIGMQLSNDWNFHSKYLENTFRRCVDRYIDDTKIDGLMMPDNHAFELFRIKRYESNGQDEFKEHVDVGDHQSAKRFLAFFLYLNEVSGGETVFPRHDMKVIPKKGRILMFPPMWTHPHIGNKVTGIKSKYTVGSYLHYLDQYDEFDNE